MNRLTKLTLQEMEIELERKRVKNINLRINARGQIKVSAPIFCTDESILNFLQNKQEWIRKHYLRFSKQTEKNLEFKTGESHLYLGNNYELLIQPACKKNYVKLQGSYLYCFIKNDTINKKALVLHWYREQLKTLLPDLIQKWETLIGVKVTSWGIKAMKTRWGTCNPHSKRIWLNLFLIKKPLICIEYVVVHELIHLLEASHNKRFYALMDKFFPEWQQCRSLLRG
ncbi:M48 family metallopeptidase [Legionella septentrionalis]|uniref:M48 family metallopeptidase n=1 Tax=Legionella septentrionalis TaxID=2498109 RepID=UPI000F8E677E|nr:SprT family zinc-dependent metalloprotease [Legionella septentrionalis]RUR13393.1 M48 family peptidase [Legionella septentrionalis]